MKIIVVGCGASGIVASIFSKNKDNEVVVLEKNSKPLKKLLLTGNGKCNYFNDDFSFEHYYSDDIKLLSSIINSDNKSRVLNFFDSIGVVAKVKNGYYYPNSLQAYSVYNSLLKEASIRGVDIVYDTTVLNIVKKNNSFVVSTNNGDYVCDKVVISTGGKSYSKTGSSGDGYLFSESFGHHINDVYPGLVQLVSDDKFFKDLSGVRSEACVSLYSDSFIKSEIGEIQFTDYGISGICIFNLSNYVGKLVSSGKKVIVEINFFDNFNISSVSSMIDFIDVVDKKVSNRSITELLEGYLNYKIVNVILKLCSIDSSCSWNELSLNDKEKLCSYLVSFSVNVVDTKGFDNAQVSVGGVSLADININNFESKLISGLYFTGEIMDVTGDCGGYNLGFAFLSGMLVGMDIGGNND
jgi:hypothetical protein